MKSNARSSTSWCDFSGSFFSPLFGLKQQVVNGRQKPGRVLHKQITGGNEDNKYGINHNVLQKANDKTCHNFYNR